MLVLTFDTETTGLPTEYNPPITQPSKWPHIVQLSYILYDTVSQKMLTHQNQIIKTTGTISPSSMAIHGVTPEICADQGIPIEHALLQFNEWLQLADQIVGHNLTFDKNMILVELHRLQAKQYFTKHDGSRPLLEYCTMKNGTNLCRINKTNYKTGEVYYKYPTLSELYIQLFQVQPVGVHDALVDVLLCLRCYFMMQTSPIDPLTNTAVDKSLKALYELHVKN